MQSKLSQVFQIVYVLCFKIIHFFCRCIFGTGGCKITQQNRTNCKLCRYQVKIYEAVKIANVKGGGRKRLSFSNIAKSEVE